MEYLLLAYKIKGSPDLVVGIDINTWSKEDLDNNLPFISYYIKSPNIIPDGYVDISSLENWNSFGYLTGHDYKFVRDRIKDYVIELDIGSPKTEEGGFNQLTDLQKSIAVQHKIGTLEQRISTVGTDININLGLYYHKNVSEIRSIRLSYAIAEVLNRIGDAYIIVLEARSLILDYIFFGIEGTAQGDIEGITDYIWGRGTWQGSGLINKPWNPSDLDNMTELCQRVENILIKGIYE